MFIETVSTSGLCGKGHNLPVTRSFIKGELTLLYKRRVFEGHPRPVHYSGLPTTIDGSVHADMFANRAVVVVIKL